MKYKDAIKISGLQRLEILETWNLNGYDEYVATTEKVGTSRFVVATFARFARVQRVNAFAMVHSFNHFMPLLNALRNMLSIGSENMFSEVEDVIRKDAMVALAKAEEIEEIEYDGTGQPASGAYQAPQKVASGAEDRKAGGDPAVKIHQDNGNPKGNPKRQATSKKKRIRSGI